MKYVKKANGLNFISIFDFNFKLNINLNFNKMKKCFEEINIKILMNFCHDC